MKIFKHIQSGQTRNVRQWLVLIHDQQKFIEDSAATHLFHQAKANGTEQQVFRLFANLKPQPLFETYSPKYPGWIFDEAQIVQDTNRLVFNITLTAVIIEHFTKDIMVQADRQSIDGEIASTEVHLHRSMFHIGQGSRLQVILHARRSDIQLEAIGIDENRGSELVMAANPAIVVTGKGLSKGDAITFDDDIDIKVFLVQQQVAHKATDNKYADIEFITDLTKLGQ